MLKNKKNTPQVNCKDLTDCPSGTQIFYFDYMNNIERYLSCPSGLLGDIIQSRVF